MIRAIGAYTIAITSIFCGLSAAQDTPTVTEKPLRRAADRELPIAILVDGESISCQLQSVDADWQCSFRTADGQARSIAAANLVRWGHPVDAGDRARVILSDGSSIVAAESWKVVLRGKESIQLREETLAIVVDQKRREGNGERAVYEAVDFPRASIRGIIVSPPPDRLRRDQLAARIASYAQAEDRLVLRNGDELSGTVTQIAAGEIQLTIAAGTAKVALEKTTAVLFNARLVVVPVQNSLRAIVGFRNGSSVVAPTMELDDASVRLTLHSGVQLTNLVTELASLQPLGGNVTYLSDTKPHSSRHVPYFDVVWPHQTDRNVLGGRLRAGGRLYSKGIGVHSAARMIYRLSSAQRTFRASVAIDDSTRRRGSAIFRVMLARGGGWDEAFASPILRGGDPPLPVHVPLGDAQGLALIVDYADYGDELDRANWLDARFE